LAVRGGDEAFGPIAAVALNIDARGGKMRPRARGQDKLMRACLGITDPKLRNRIAQLLETIASRCSF
jgi:hypothetical protein